jgi:uncharacterized iron-regulated membrane protein
MAIGMLLGSLLAAVGALTGFVMWRDHRRSSAGDRTATDIAVALAERYHAEREGGLGAREREQFEGM